MTEAENVKEKSFAIKVPVFASELILNANDLFSGASYTDMINYAKKKIDIYISNPIKISKEKRNKTQTKEIDKILYFDHIIGEVPALLIKISAYNTNLYDGYVEIEQKIALKVENKVGSDNNYVVLYPYIIGIDSSNLKHQWLILVYEDPNKESSEIISTVKIVLRKILGIPIANIKLPDLLDQLKKIKYIPELYLRFSSIKTDANEVDVKLQSYLAASSLRKYKEDLFKNIPLDETNEIILDHSREDEYSKKEVRIINGKKEYKITREIKQEAKDRVTETVEEIFNLAIGVSEKELDDIYKQDFIIAKITAVLNAYLCCDGQN